MKRPLLILILTLLATRLMAQDFSYADYKPQDLAMKKYSKDTSAHAVVLAEFGKTGMRVTESINIEFEYHVKIKILDSKGVEKGNIAIPVYKSDDNYFEDVSEISGVTYYTDENGSVQHTDLDPSKVFKVNENKYCDLVKFAMPNVRAGCTIEYKYKIISPYIRAFRTWLFQSDIPKVYSAYEVRIPAVYNYNIALRGNLQLSKTLNDLQTDCFTANGIKCDCSKMTYIINDVPAFIEEDNMTAPKNFLSGIYFELSDRVNLTTGNKEKISQEWSDVDYQLKHHDYFGSQLKKKDLLKDHITPVIAGRTDDLDKAKAIYAYIQKNMKWNGIYTIYSEAGIRKAFDKHTGMVADVNFALISALNTAGISTEAVLLSTRDNGIVSKLYPVVTEFNYVIARANIGGKSYLLDATDPLLSFGMLPLRCLNDQGRVMSLDKPSYWIEMNDASQKKSTTYTLDLTLQDNGKLKGTLNKYFNGYDAYRERVAIKKFNTTDEFVENLGEKQPKVKILKADIINVDSLNKPVSESYEIEMNAYDNLDHNRLIFNPFLFDRVTTNPFKLAQRTYPVDWGMPSENRFVLTMHLPDGYTIENPPQNANIAMPNNGGRFIVSYDPGGSSFTFSHVTLFNKSIYSADEYPYIKELFNKIILSEKTEMVFRKKI